MLCTLLRRLSRMPNVGDIVGKKEVKSIWTCGNWNKVVVEYTDGSIGLVGPINTSGCITFTDEIIFVCVLKKAPEEDKLYKPYLYQLARKEISIGKVPVKFREIKQVPNFKNFYIAKDYDWKFYLVLVH